MMDGYSGIGHVGGGRIVAASVGDAAYRARILHIDRAQLIHHGINETES